jgi:formate dehydrogenase major subunit
MGREWEADSAKDLWDNEISAVAPILAGVKYARLENDGLQWPVPTLEHMGTPIMHKDGCFTCGLAQFKPVDWTPPAETPDEAYPLVLSTGRRLYHYHTRTQTGRCEGLNTLLPEETVDISAADAARIGIADGEMVKVSSRRGQVKVRARVTPEAPEGTVWMAFHFRENNANWLTNTAFDPITLTAEYKACAVKVEKM